ncbi:MAG: nicotinate phosphoribosyltransferase, partial [Christensenella sp.]
IRDTIMQGAKIDSFGVGERMITSKSDPVFGGVYKLVAVEKDGEIEPKIKISENVQKITLPHFKTVFRLFEATSNKAIADVICTHDEIIDDRKPYVLFDPEYTWKHKTVTDYRAEPLMRKIFENGALVYKIPDTDAVREHCATQLTRLWDEVKRFENPHKYYVDYSEKLWNLRAELLAKRDWESAPSSSPDM